MKMRTITLMAGILLLASGALLAQNPNPNPNPQPAPALPANSSTTQTKNCPGAGANCEGDCIFTVSIISQAGANCAANRVDVTFQANSTAPNCVADFNRASDGNISYVLCSGETCTLDETYFPDNTFWPPYTEGDGLPKPAGKDSLSQACRAAIDLRVPAGAGPPPLSLFSYRFKGVSSVDPNFDMETICSCGGGTVLDTIKVRVTAVDAEVVDDTEDGRGGGTGDGTGNKTGSAGEAEMFAHGSTFVVSNIYPNPASSELNVVFQALEASHVQVIVHDQMGKQVKQSIEMLDIGDNLYTLDVTDLQDGFYFMTLIGPYGDKVVLKFIHR